MKSKKKSITKNSIWKVGSIVALKTHLSKTINDFSIIFISGDPTLSSPLMIITEVIKSSIDNENTLQCKCMWFSQKTGIFSEAWIYSDLLKVVEPFNNKNLTSDNNVKFGTSVIFKTSNIELGKKKSTFRQQDNIGSNYTITAELSFVSPVMQILGTVEYKGKDSVEHKKTGEIVKEITTCMVKCKYYNGFSNKFSEVLIPIEAIELIPKVSEKTLDQLKATINSNNFLLVKIGKTNKNTILKCEKINFRNGIYYAGFFSYVENNHLEVAVNEIKILEIKNNFYSEELPKFKESLGKLIATPINTENIKRILTKIANKKYLRICYKDINEVMTWRTLDDCKVILSDEMDESKKIIKVEYLKAHCILRNATRYFRIDRIQKIQILDLEK